MLFLDPPSELVHAELLLSMCHLDFRLRDENIRAPLIVDLANELRISCVVVCFILWVIPSFLIWYTMACWVFRFLLGVDSKVPRCFLGLLKGEILMVRWSLLDGLECAIAFI